jgi:hypothetical protein
MTEIDLVPADYARMQTARRRLRRLGAALLAIAALTLVARAMLAGALSAGKEDLARLEATQRSWQEAKARTEKHSAEALASEKQLAALAELRGRDHLRLLLDAMDRAYVEKVWFDEIRYFRRELGSDGTPPKVAGASRAQHVEQRVSVVGHAMNHATLAQFMKQLEQQPAVADLALVDTGSRSYPQATVIDFKLSLGVDPAGKGRP